MESNSPKKAKPAITKLNIISLVLIILFFLTLFSGYERICALVYPVPLKQYYEILGDKTKDFRRQKLTIGHAVNFQFKENKKSLGELYSLTDVKFIPENRTLSIWEGDNKPETWNKNTAAIENMQRFRIKFSIPVPNNKNLEGNTIAGTLYFKLSYPVLINYTEKIGGVTSETWEKPMTIHIFSNNELNRLSNLASQMIKIWLICLGLILIPILLVLIKQRQKYQKIHPPRVV